MSQKQDKQSIYNSAEWRRLRDAKREANPLCERCIALGKAAGVKEGWLRAVQVIHHKIPIETARNFEEMKALAFRWNNLQSLCFQCHSEIHQQMNSRSKEGHKRASEAALERWKARHSK
jgi:5-methylcytosine-specific restriction protein A